MLLPEQPWCFVRIILRKNFFNFKASSVKLLALKKLRSSPAGMSFVSAHWISTLISSSSLIIQLFVYIRFIHSFKTLLPSQISDFFTNSKSTINFSNWIIGKKNSKWESGVIQERRYIEKTQNETTQIGVLVYKYLLLTLYYNVILFLS